MLLAAAEPALTISIVSAALVAASFGIGAAVRHREPEGTTLLRSILRRTQFALAVMAMSGPVLAIPLLIGATLGAAILTDGAPLAAMLLIMLAGLVGFWLAYRSSDYGMAGCTRGIAMLLAGYLVAWGLVSLVLTPNVFQSHRLVAPALLKPPLAALPIVFLVERLTRRPDTKLRAILAALVFVGAWAAICFPMADSAMTAQWLPANRWLRYPLAGILAAGPLIVWFIVLASTNKSRSNGSWLVVVATAILGMITGLAWAAADTIFAE
ncbi:hypothetical protein [Sphingomonas psychrotolerans]|uniref:Uncharacterized protein n=1 Tax=Sphingomonas psychrotolerans TaxID=1327635 RepID=A0A2K8MEE0_9SPHN|nr:hypothetical protein [Sphingomonas psychrotolerans]ATY32262.1 hypothetical protein CVN68_09960 [Sphingomonas psychrotolerans]